MQLFLLLALANTLLWNSLTNNKKTKMYTVYLAGEIHSNWREEIINGCKDLNITFLTPENDHSSRMI